MRKWNRERGASSAGLLLAIVVLLAIVFVAVYLVPDGREVEFTAEELERNGEAAADELGNAVDRVQEKSQDALITAKVKTALALSKSVSSFDLDVDTLDERVTLTGRVPTEEAKRTALRIASDVSGVVEVVDHLEVDSSVEGAPTDTELASRISNAELKVTVYESLLDDERIEARRIRALVDGGVVTLVGQAATLQQKEIAGDIVSRVPGVRSVVDDLEVASVPSTQAAGPES